MSESTDDKTKWLPDAHFGSANAPKPAPLPEAEETPDDDEELDETPKDVSMMLGFDPKELADV